MPRFWIMFQPKFGGRLTKKAREEEQKASKSYDGPGVCGTTAHFSAQPGHRKGVTRVQKHV